MIRSKAMKTITILLFANALISCAAFAYGKEMQIEDCVTRHLKAVPTHSNGLDGDFYQKIVDSCKQIYTGRP